MAKDVILTGIRSNEELTLGNYLGAFLPMVQLQKEKVLGGGHQLNMFVPDLHSFTTPVDHKQLYANTMRNLKYFAAAGLDIDSEDTFIYRQSYIPAHSELTVILNNFATFWELRRMQQFEEKAGIIKSTGGKIADPKAVRERAEHYQTYRKEHQDLDKHPFDPVQLEYDYWALLSNLEFTERALERHHMNNRNLSGVSVGLFDYPVLMAADILLYSAHWIPVGEDQTQHIEFTRDLALRLNKKFGDLFVVPHETKKQLAFHDKDRGVRIRSLRNPEKKMSKSVNDPAGTILLSDKPADAAKKVMGATTDSLGKINLDFAKQPGISNLLQILALLNGSPLGDTVKKWSGKASYGDLKQAVADAVSAFLNDFQAKLESADEPKLLKKLEESEADMSLVANETLERVQKAVGLRP